MVKGDEKGEITPGFLIGERIYIKPLEKDEMVYIRKWTNDPEIRRLTGEVKPMTPARGDDYFENVRSDTNREWFIIVLKENDKVIGETGLLRMFSPWRTTDLTIIIGEKEEWGKGYGTEAINLMLDYAFGYLNFHRVSIGVVGFNERALRFYEAVGFKREGIQRDGYYYNHEYHDFIMMSLLEDEFRTLQKSRSENGL